MLKTFVNEEEVFKVNEDFEIEVETIGTTPTGQDIKIVIVDNFYKYPEKVRDLALMIPPTTNKRVLSNLPSGEDSGRINAFYLQDQLGPVYDNIIKAVYPEIHFQFPEGHVENSFKQATFIVNVMTSENLPPRVPHIDFPDMRVLASLIFLNTPEECKGGTAFYSFGGELVGRSEPTTIDVEGKIKPDHFVVDDCGDFKLVKLVEMKWNRMIIYSQCLFHSAYIKPGMYTDGNYRLNQVFFI